MCLFYILEHYPSDFVDFVETANPDMSCLNADGGNLIHAMGALCGLEVARGPSSYGSGHSISSSTLIMDIFALLIAKGVDVDHHDSYGRTPLQSAVLANRIGYEHDLLTDLISVVR